MDHQLPDEYRFELVDCVEYPPERPESIGKAVSLVLDYAKQLAIQRKTWAIQQAINDGKDPSPLIRELAEIEARETKPGGNYDGFGLVPADELEEVSETRDFVEGLLIDGGFSVVYGPSNCGKSFWALDLAAHVASQPTWRHGESEIENGAVIYVALEGASGVKNRIKALRKRGILTRGDRLLVCRERFSLLEPGHADRMAKTIAAVAESLDVPVRLVILDTLSRAMAGGDENSGQDMTTAIATVDAIRAATGAHVIVIHHSGKDEAKGARGHSSLRAAADTEIEIFRPAGQSVSTVRVTKQRDLPIGEPMPFTLETVVLGTDRRGKEITSCVVRHEDPIMAAKRGNPGKRREFLLKRLLALLPAVSTADWQRRAADELGLSESTFHRLRREIPETLAAKDNDGRWVRVEVSETA
jgi:hypothetical protein